MLAIADVPVVVSSAKESAKWWQEKMGFAVHHVGGHEHAVMVAPPGDRFVLHLCEGFAPLEPGDTGIAFMTDEIEALCERMEGAGVGFAEPLQRTEFGGMAKFQDPDGNVFWLLGAPRAFVQGEISRVAATSASEGTKKPASSSPRSPKDARRERSSSFPPRRNLELGEGEVHRTQISRVNGPRRAGVAKLGQKRRTQDPFS